MVTETCRVSVVTAWRLPFPAGIMTHQQLVTNEPIN